MTVESRVRVLVVDDSAFARKVLRSALGRDPRIEVVGHARDGLEALDQIAALKPDVITLDLMMPGLDGLGVLDALDPETGPRVVVVSVSGADTGPGLAALERGALDIVVKPTALATDRLYELAEELVEKVVIAGRARARTYLRPPPGRPPRVPTAHHTELVVVGTSTGGPQALTRLIGGLPAGFPVPVAVVVHLPADFTGPLARRLDEISAVEVGEAGEGELLRPGRVIVAPGDRHLLLRRDGTRLRAHLSFEPAESLHRPAVDVLFRSAAQAAGAGVLGLVLTGMGDDGLEGARAVCRAGGRVLTEAAASAIVDGMPRRVREAGLSAGEAPIERMAGLLLERL